MADATTSRVLRLLSLLQTRRTWSGTELAARVGVSPRTIRRDIERLRELDYRIVADLGTDGGYRLEAGSDLPPLLFSAEEAVALALGLRAGAANVTVRDMADLTVSVLAKLEQVLPSAVRLRVRATQAAVAAPWPIQAEQLVDPETIAVLALACRDSGLVRFSYHAADGRAGERRVEPVALVPRRRRWYLVAWDRERHDWRTFRLDRLTDLVRTGVTTSRRHIPGSDAAAFVEQRFATTASPRFVATIRIEATFGDVERYLGHYTGGLEADGPTHTLWRISDDRLEVLAGALAWLVWPFEIVTGDELHQFMRAFTVQFTV